MADKDKGRSALSTVLAFGILIGLIIWLGLVFSAEGEKRLEQACKPVEYSTGFLHELVTSILGRQPTWTLYAQQYLMTGCYYSFSVLMTETTTDDNVGASMAAPEETATGGIQ